MIILILSAIVLIIAIVLYYFDVIIYVRNEQKKAIQEGKKKAEIDKVFNDDPYAFPWQAAEDI